MDFRVLGPLEVWDGESAVAVAGARERSVLAILVTSANRVVSSERIAAVLWGDNPPETAANTVQVYVSHVRRALEPARQRRGPGELVLTRAPGYELRAPVESIDARRFEQRAEQGGRLVRSDPETAVDILQTALQEWRGPALVEFQSMPFAIAEANRLEERRLVAVEGRVEAELSLGRHDACAAELEGLVGQHPLRERLRTHQMLALYRAGRQADALRSCADLRERLRDDLGIDPSPEVRALERAILVQDPSLAWKPAGDPGHGRQRAATPASRPIPTAGGVLLDFATDSGRDLVPLAGVQITLGRDPTSDVVLQGDATVSRRHAEMVRDADGWRLRDLGSVNGSFVNGEPAGDGHRLHDGDEIRLGETRARFRLTAPDTTTVPFRAGTGPGAGEAG